MAGFLLSIAESLYSINCRYGGVMRVHGIPWFHVMA